MTRDDLHSLATKALHQFGATKQMRRYAEECAEAITATMKLLDERGASSEEHFAEELVGVLVTAHQMEILTVNAIGCDAYDRIWSAQLAKLAAALEAVK